MLIISTIIISFRDYGISIHYCKIPLNITPIPALFFQDVHTDNAYQYHYTADDMVNMKSFI